MRVRLLLSLRKDRRLHYRERSRVVGAGRRSSSGRDGFCCWLVEESRGRKEIQGGWHVHAHAPSRARACLSSCRVSAFVSRDADGRRD